MPADTTPKPVIKPHPMPGFVSAKPLFNGGQITQFSNNGTLGYSTNYPNPFIQTKPT